MWRAAARRSWSVLKDAGSSRWNVDLIQLAREDERDQDRAAHSAQQGLPQTGQDRCGRFELAGLVDET